MPETLRVLHWNVHGWVDPVTGGSNVGAVARLLAEHAPDAVSLVEVSETWGEPSTLAGLAATAGYVPVFAPVFERGTDEPAGGFGNAILSRRPVLAVRQRQLTWPDSVYADDEPTEPRCVVLATVAAGAGTAVHVGSTHLPRHRAASRVAALRRLAGVARELSGPWVVCGDFNAPAGDWPDGGTGAGFAVAPPDPTPTCPAHRPTESIDYAVATAGTAMTAEVLRAGGSDHLPVLVTVDL